MLFASTKRDLSLCGPADALPCVVFAAMSCSGRISRAAFVVDEMSRAILLFSCHDERGSISCNILLFIGLGRERERERASSDFS